MRIEMIAIAVAAVAIAGPALAQSGEQLAKSRGCLKCHAVSARKEGPSFADSAAKYRGDAKAADKLVAMLRDGKGHDRVKASDAELRAIVEYVLKQQK